MKEKIFIVDDSQSIIDVLKMILIKEQMGTICGCSTDPVEALEDIKYSNPDVIIVDFLMPELDGVSLIKKAKKIVPEASFVMLSQVSNKDMVSAAYEAGVEFYIQKPINGIEVINVINNVMEKRAYAQKLKMLNNILGIEGESGEMGEAKAISVEVDYTGALKDILAKLGVLGESGADDIITMCGYFFESGADPSTMKIKDLCAKFSSAPKTMEQKMRRAAASGLSGMAHICLNDYDNPVLQSYGIPAFGYEQIRKEMDYIQEKSTQHGVVKMKKFISYLVYEARRQA